LPFGPSDCKAALRLRAAGDDMAAMPLRLRRFSAQAALVARIYAGYKLIQATARLAGRDADARYRRQHRRSAEAMYRLATRLEGLPIKVCQFIGSRADVLPAEYVGVLSRLQDRVPPRALATLRPVLDTAFGRPLGEAFATFDATPIASASLAQVHRARLHDGREVAVKIQYPDIERIVAIDLRNFAFLVRVLARLEPDFDFRVVIDEVEQLVPLELDFLNEARNATRMAECFRGRADVWVPAVIPELSSPRVLVTEYAPGVRVSDAGGLERMGAAPKDVARRLIELFCEMILVHGFFHADPHPGNILVQPGPRLVLLDFGLSKEFPPGFREGLARLTAAIVGGDSRQIAAAFRALGFRTRDESDESLAVLGEAFLGWALRNGQAYATPEMVEHFNQEIPRIVRRNPIVHIPSDILLVGRVMGLLSGIGKQLGSEVDVGAVLLRYLAAPPLRSAAS
jgi:predicted unusual protein kinase regulating ubiquinone biosynthesis (AarF/ABC1/UbiB family)